MKKVSVDPLDAIRKNMLNMSISNPANIICGHCRAQPLLSTTAVNRDHINSPHKRHRPHHWMPVYLSLHPLRAEEKKIETKSTENQQSQTTITKQ